MTFKLFQHNKYRQFDQMLMLRFNANGWGLFLKCLLIDMSFVYECLFTACNFVLKSTTCFKIIGLNQLRYAPTNATWAEI